MNRLTLLQLNTLVRRRLESGFDDVCWLQAELSEVRESRGHCYLEFVQKDEQTGTLVAKARGQIWASLWAYLRPYFLRSTGQMLSAGMQVLVSVQVTFHPLYGYSLNVTDIDPTYTLGDLARRRREIMQRLRNEGIDTMNKELALPPLLQRIAVISSASAAGYEDFCNQLTSNPYALAFQTRLFPSAMQGDDVEAGVIHALNLIAATIDQWDAVVIIRGGGSTSDLSGFDTLALAENVAQFPLPVITGIGHERDDTVIDLIAHTRVKTPTAAAEFLIRHQLAQLTAIDGFSLRLQHRASDILQGASARLSQLSARLPASVRAAEAREQLRVSRLAVGLQTASTRYTDRQQQRLAISLQALKAAADAYFLRRRTSLALIQGQIDAADPIRMLRLGYSITRVDGHVVKSVAALSPGIRLDTFLADGHIESTITSSEK